MIGIIVKISFYWPEIRAFMDFHTIITYLWSYLFDYIIDCAFIMSALKVVAKKYCSQVSHIYFLFSKAPYWLIENNLRRHKSLAGSWKFIIHFLSCFLDYQRLLYKHLTKSHSFIQLVVHFCSICVPLFAYHRINFARVLLYGVYQPKTDQLWIEYDSS